MSEGQRAGGEMRGRSPSEIVMGQVSEGLIALLRILIFILRAMESYVCFLNRQISAKGTEK